MKYIKKFEEINEQPFNVGDNVIGIIGDNNFTELSDFINDNVGVITSLRSETALVKYLNAPENIKQYCLVYNDETNACTYMINYYHLKLASQKQIENQKLKDDAYKYNI